MLTSSKHFLIRTTVSILNWLICPYLPFTHEEVEVLLLFWTNLPRLYPIFNYPVQMQIFKRWQMMALACWSSDIAFVSGAGGLNLGQVKSDTVLPTARYCFNISPKEVVLPGCNDAQMSPETCYVLWRSTAITVKDFDLIRLMMA